MRIISGRYARRTLRAPRGGDVRPTSDRVREALFSALESRGAVAGARVADLFAGSGALGLEALSRGASAVTFVERAPAAAAALRSNVEALDAGAECTIVREDALAWLGRAPAGTFDLVFADPPYDLPAVAELPSAARALLAPDGVFVLEHDRQHDFSDAAGLIFSRPYGRTVLSAFGPLGEAR